MKVAIQGVSLASLGKMGCLLGTVAAFLPSLLCAVLGLGLGRVLLHWLETWPVLTVPFLSKEIARFDLVQILGLDQVVHFLQAVEAVSGWVLLLVVLGMAVAAGVVLAIVIVVVGLAYNLLAAGTGGLVVEMQPVTRRGRVGRRSRR